MYKDATSVSRRKHICFLFPFSLALPLLGRNFEFNMSLLLLWFLLKTTLNEVSLIATDKVLIIFFPIYFRVTIGRITTLLHKVSVLPFGFCYEKLRGQYSRQNRFKHLGKSKQTGLLLSYFHIFQVSSPLCLYSSRFCVEKQNTSFLAEVTQYLVTHEKRNKSRGKHLVNFRVTAVITKCIFLYSMISRLQVFKLGNTLFDKF